MTQDPQPPRPPWGLQVHARALVIWGVVAFDLLVVALAAWTLATSRHQYVDRAEVVTDNLALVIEQTLIGDIRQVDMVLQTVQDQVEGLTGAPRPAATAQILAHQFTRSPLLDALRIAGAEGRVEHAAGFGSGAVAEVSDRDFFQHLKHTPSTHAFISRPSQDGSGQAWAITVARRLNLPTGGFQGVVFATLRLDQLTREFAQVDVGRAGSISLRGGDLSLLARYPAYEGRDAFIGDTRISGDYLEAVQSRRQVSHFSTFSRLDGEVRTYTFRHLQEPPFYILVGLAQHDYLAAWRKEALLSGSAVSALVLLSVAVAWLARTTWRRQLQAQAEREHLIDELTAALAEVKQLKGMLPICGHCKKIRDDQGYWKHLESYLSEHSEATFTHGVCPDCAQELRREFLASRERPDPDPR